jgi:hypothetical protein
MPYKSQAQAGYFHTHKAQLEKQGVNVSEWDAATKGKHLPKKVGSHQKTHKTMETYSHKVHSLLPKHPLPHRHTRALHATPHSVIAEHMPHRLSPAHEKSSLHEHFKNATEHVQHNGKVGKMEVRGV